MATRTEPARALLIDLHSVGGDAALFLGAEPRFSVLDALEKGIRVDEASQALKALKGAGIGTYVYLLFGTPAETPEAAQRTLSFTAEHSRLIDFLNLAVFDLPAGWEEAGRLNVHPTYEGDLSLYADFEHPDRWGCAGRCGTSWTGSSGGIPPLRPS